MVKSFASFLEYNLPDELKPFIAAVIHGESEAETQFTYPVHAIGFPLIIHVYGDLPILHVNGTVAKARSRLNLAGQIFDTEPKIEIDGTFGQIGFVLYPSATYYLFHKKGDFFLNSWRTFEATISNGVEGLHKDLNQCKTPIDRVPVLLDFLKKLAENRLPPIPWLDEALGEILRKNGVVGQEELAENAGISLRHFRRKFKEIVGVAPKYFCKVIQLNTIFELIKTADADKLHHMALDCGYYDQAHFINDFRKLIGDSPSGFLKGEHAYVKTYLGRRAV